MNSAPKVTNRLPATLPSPEKTSSAPSSATLDLEWSTASTRSARISGESIRFISCWDETTFVLTVVFSQLISEFFASGFTLLVPSLTRDLNMSPSSSTWPANAFTVAVSASLIPCGRLVDILGARPIFIGGLTWISAWSTAAGFARSSTVLIVCRAMQGLATAAYLSAALTLLGESYPAGARKNMVFSIYGAIAPLGLYVGMTVAGLVSQYATWPWFFWIGAILSCINTVLSYFTIRGVEPIKPRKRPGMDWLGTATSSGTLALCVTALTLCSQSPKAWRDPSVYMTATMGTLLLVLTIYVEGWVAQYPLVPSSLFRIHQMVPVIISLLLSYGTTTVYLLYSNLYIQNVLVVQPTVAIAWFAPMAVAGIALALTGGLILHKVPGTPILVFANMTILASAACFAFAPNHVNYWASIFPAMICAALSVDMSYSIANVFLSTSLPQDQQGLAGALASLLFYLSGALQLSIADIIAAAFYHDNQRESYRAVFWFQLGCGAAAVLTTVVFVRIGKAAE